MTDLSDEALRKVYEKVYPSNELNPARLAALRAVAEYATRELRERLERAQGALRECPALTGDYSFRWPDKHALAIREAKKENT